MAEKICTATGEYEEYQTVPCTCGGPDCPDLHLSPEVPQREMVQIGGENRYVITDDDMFIGEDGAPITMTCDWSTKFKCPVCPVGAIGAIPHFASFCPDCGTGVAIRSDHVKGTIVSRRKK